MIYLDHASTTPLSPEVFEAMKPYLVEHFGNPSSIHQFGQVTRRAIDDARNEVIAAIGAFSVHEICFTGGGTESCNMAIYGAAFARQDQGKHLVISAVEHAAVREAAFYLRDNFDFELTEVQPDADGVIQPSAVQAALRPDTILVSVMLANNEIGTVQPVAEIAELVREHGALFHTDACQAPAYLSVRVDELKPDLMTLSASKVNGPKAVGLLYMREGVKITPLIHGGGQEFRMRGGTESAASIVGFAKALSHAAQNHEANAEKVKAMRDGMLDKLLEIPGVKLNGSREARLPGNINLHIPGVSGESLVMRLDMEGLAVSSGSACSSGKTEPSHVLLALGQDEEAASQSLRISLGTTTTVDEVDKATEILQRIIRELM